VASCGAFGAPPEGLKAKRTRKWINIGPFIRHALTYRGFVRQGARVRIITFRVTTRLQSKSNRCILHTTLVIWLLTRPRSSGQENWQFGSKFDSNLYPKSVILGVPCSMFLYMWLQLY
jgi:hypothetical protein